MAVGNRSYSNLLYQLKREFGAAPGKDNDFGIHSEMRLQPLLLRTIPTPVRT